MRLGPDTLSRLGAEVERFDYDRDAQKFGIVHFGIGAFHRAHQAWYSDLAMSAGERDWAICGVSLRSRTVAEQLVPQSGLYTLTERSGTRSRTRLVGAVREILFAPEEAEQVVSRLAHPACAIVSFTVTEKGYARGEGGRLDLALARSSFFPMLAEGLSRRRQAGLGGVTLLCCDNLADNGSVLDGLVRQWLEAYQPGLLDWYDANCRVPSTMIDRIVPRSGRKDIAALEERIGLVDEGAVFTEPFSQWVIEDDFAGPRPRWEEHGAQLVADVGPYETAKLRMLNGAHSLLAYGGLQAGHAFVHEAVADPHLRALADRLMREEASPTIEAAEGQDLSAYADHLIARFGDPALMHRLDQIAMDGTQKIPQRWLDTALALHRAGRSFEAIRAAFDAWVWHLEDGRFVDDPYGRALKGIVSDGGRQAVTAYCLTGGANTAPLWPGYEDLAPLLG